MGQQSVRQAARRGVMDALAERRREQAEQDKRLQELSVQVAAALMERDAAVAAAERRAGQALRKMVEVEGLSVRDALTWCGAPVGTREAARLVKAAAPTETTTAEELSAGEAAAVQDSTGEAATGDTPDTPGARPGRGGVTDAPTGAPTAEASRASDPASAAAS